MDIQAKSHRVSIRSGIVRAHNREGPENVDDVLLLVFPALKYRDQLVSTDRRLSCSRYDSCDRGTSSNDDADCSGFVAHLHSILTHLELAIRTVLLSGLELLRITRSLYIHPCRGFIYRELLVIAIWLSLTNLRRC
jgi:hypothetical protein